MDIGAEFLTDFAPQCSKCSTQKMHSINIITKYLLLCLTAVCSVRHDCSLWQLNETEGK